MAWGSNTVTTPTAGPTFNVTNNDLTPEQWRTKRDELLQQWIEKKKTLESAKAEEMELRKQIVSFVADPDKIEGTENIELGNGYKLKAVKKVTYNFNVPEGVDKRDFVDDVLDKLEKVGPEGKFLADRLVKWNPELSVSEYKELPENFKKIVDEVIVTKEGSPTLELVEPKAKK